MATATHQERSSSASPPGTTHEEDREKIGGPTPKYAELATSYDARARTRLSSQANRHEEYDRCIGWGHSSYRHAFEFAAQVGGKELIPFHHGPSHDDETLDRLLETAKRQFKPTCAVSAGQEGAVYRVGASRP